MSWVRCVEKISSPAPDYHWIPANMECGAKCEVAPEIARQPGAVMEVRCPYGHRFFATKSDVVWMGDE